MKFDTPEKRAKLVKWFWLISWVYMVAGYLIIFYIFFLKR